MGYFSAFLNAAFVSKKVRDAVMIDELQKQNKLLKKLVKEKKTKKSK